jgi:integrative and conjugative element protein (TIGR02256 family)
MPETDPPFLVFSRHNGGRIKVTAAVLRVMQSYAQHGRRATEAGGVLLGRYLQGSADVVVDAVTVPMPGDKRSRYSFYRAKARHQAAIDATWQASGGTCTYLGEWHTHPETYPTPSGIDTTDWRRRLRTDDYHDELFFLIVGTVEIRAWSGKGALLNLTPMLSIPLTT